MKTIPKVVLSHKNEAIILLRASSNYTFLTFSSGKEELSAYSLNVFATHFNAKEYVRVNRSFLIQKNFILYHYKKNGKDFFRLKNNRVIGIPRRKLEDFKLMYPSLF